MTLDELKAEEDDVEEEVAEGEDAEDSSLEENLLEACEKIDKLLTVMEQITIVPKGRVVKRLPRHFNEVLEEATEFLEELEYQRDVEE